MDDTNILNEFLELIKTDSASFAEREIADILIPRLKEIGCEVFEDDTAKKVGGNCGNVIARLPGEGESILLCAHMDRVPLGLGIKPVIEGNVIRSDGTTILAADDISGVVAILDGLRRLRESGKKHCPVEVLFTVGEEKQLAGTRNFDYSLIKSKRCYCVDSTGRAGRIVNAAPSYYHLRLDVYGKKAHAGVCPENGTNALTAAGKILAVLPDGRLDSETTANWAMIKAGDAVNVVCDHVVIEGETRSHTESKLLDYLQTVEKLSKEAIEGTGATCEFTYDKIFTAFRVEESDPLIKAAERAAGTLGLPFELYTSGGGLDANNLNQHGILSVGVSSGYKNTHGTDELQYVDDLKASGKLVEQLVLECSR